MRQEIDVKKTDKFPHFNLQLYSSSNQPPTDSKNISYIRHSLLLKGYKKSDLISKHFSEKCLSERNDKSGIKILSYFYVNSMAAMG
jgi:hypothetical protein